MVSHKLEVYYERMLIPQSGKATTQDSLSHIALLVVAFTSAQIAADEFNGWQRESVRTGLIEGHDKLTAVEQIDTEIGSGAQGGSLDANERAESIKPNIVLILADDLGYGDVGRFGQTTLRTPHLDQLASEGLKFNRHYSGSTVCSPSRTVLMTGLHTGHASIRTNWDDDMPYDIPTVARLLRDAGYATGCFGKWGVGDQIPDHDPARKGFREFYGYVDRFHAHFFSDFSRPQWQARIA